MSKPPVANPNIAAEFERLFGPPPVHKVEDEDSYDAILCGLAHDIGPLDTIECVLLRDLGPSVVSRNPRAQRSAVPQVPRLPAFLC